MYLILFNDTHFFKWSLSDDMVVCLSHIDIYAFKANLAEYSDILEFFFSNDGRPVGDVADLLMKMASTIATLSKNNTVVTSDGIFNTLSGVGDSFKIWQGNNAQAKFYAKLDAILEERGITIQ